jgi:hypothetical protein
VDKWCAVLENKGCFVGVYASLNTFKNHLDDTRLARYIHWVAQWTKRCTYGNKDILGFWQFGGETNLIRSNKIAGVVCDQNYMLLDLPERIKKGGFNGFGVTSSKEIEKKTNEEIADEVIAGKWGNGSERFTRLSNAGYNYGDIQSVVDNKMQNRGIAKGDRVVMSADAVVYGKKTKFASFVYSSKLYVREIRGDRVVISLQEEGNITGAVDIKYLRKV